jgi:hypothetical protein
VDEAGRFGQRAGRASSGPIEKAVDGADEGTPGGRKNGGGEDAHEEEAHAERC